MRSVDRDEARLRRARRSRGAPKAREGKSGDREREEEGIRRGASAGERSMDEARRDARDRRARDDRGLEEDRGPEARDADPRLRRHPAREDSSCDRDPGAKSDVAVGRRGNVLCGDVIEIRRRKRRLVRRVRLARRRRRMLHRRSAARAERPKAHVRARGVARRRLGRLRGAVRSRGYRVHAVRRRGRSLASGVVVPARPRASARV
mmetsp:Transcript_8917/g.32679  ORF Transcript_8917/g.32679 Transcript_8917/m.32679 type:complete len:206 (-) Transcript_8917:209-826(-)